MISDLRRYSQQTTFRLVAGFILILYLIGLGLISLMYGWGAALIGLLCLGAAIVPITASILLFWVMEWIVKKGNPGLKK